MQSFFPLERNGMEGHAHRTSFNFKQSNTIYYWTESIEHPSRLFSQGNGPAEFPILMPLFLGQIWRNDARIKLRIGLESWASQVIVCVCVLLKQVFLQENDILYDMVPLTFRNGGQTENVHQSISVGVQTPVAKVEKVWAQLIRDDMTTATQNGGLGKFSNQMTNI